MWQEISDKIKSIVGEDNYITHCGLVKEIKYHDDILYLECPNEIYTLAASRCIRRSGYNNKVIWSYTNQEFTIKEENTTDIKTITKTNTSPKQKRRSFEKSPKFKSKEELDNYIEKTKEDVKELDADKQQSYNANFLKVTNKEKAYIRNKLQQLIHSINDYYDNYYDYHNINSHYYNYNTNDYYDNDNIKLKY